MNDKNYTKQISGFYDSIHYKSVRLFSFSFNPVFRLWSWNTTNACDRYFFPIPIAIAITAFVHLMNNIFKLILLRKNIHWTVTFRFGLSEKEIEIILLQCL